MENYSELRTGDKWRMSYFVRDIGVNGWGIPDFGQKKWLSILGEIRKECYNEVVAYHTQVDFMNNLLNRS